MSKNNRRKIIPPQDESISISLNHIYKENYPLFCFKYLSETSISTCRDHKFFFEFLIRLQKISQLGWPEIRTAPRHGFGMESISVDQIKPQLPACITPDVRKLHVFRATGDNHPFIGLQIDRIFRVLLLKPTLEIFMIMNKQIATL